MQLEGFFAILTNHRCPMMNLSAPGITGHSNSCLPAPELLFLVFHGDEPCVPLPGKGDSSQLLFQLPARQQQKVPFLQISKRSPKSPIPVGLALALHSGQLHGVEIQLILLDFHPALHPPGMEYTALGNDLAISWHCSKQGIVFISDHVGNGGPESLSVFIGETTQNPYPAAREGKSSSCIQGKGFFVFCERCSVP